MVVYVNGSLPKSGEPIIEPKIFLSLLLGPRKKGPQILAKFWETAKTCLDFERLKARRLEGRFLNGPEGLKLDARFWQETATAGLCDYEDHPRRAWALTYTDRVSLVPTVYSAGPSC